MYIKRTDICIITRVLTSHCCASSGEGGVMEDVKKWIKWIDICTNTRALTSRCCEGGGDERCHGGRKERQKRT